MNQKIKYLSLVLVSSLFISGCTSKSATTNNENMDLNLSSPSPTATANITVSPTVSQTKENPVVSLKTKNGEILIKLYRDQTPKTVANFIQKSDTGFYNGLTFHRVIAGFMAQGGDPTGTGMGGGKQDSELNNTPFVRGSLGLARTAETKSVSNDSQFFICFTTEGCQHLTSEYVNFGEVISGLDVLDKITQGDKIISLTSKTK